MAVPGNTRRAFALELALALAAMLAALPLRAATTLAEAMRRAREMREQSVRDGDAAYGAVVLHGDAIVGAAPSRVVASGDPAAHAETQALQDAIRRIGTPQLTGAVLVSTSRPCRMCEAAAARAGIARMVYGEALTDAGTPRP